MINLYIFILLGITALVFAFFCWLRLISQIKNKKFDYRIIWDAGAYRVPETMAQLFNIYLAICLTLAGAGFIWLSLIMNNG